MARVSDDLSDYTVKELRELKDRVDGLILQKDKTERADLRSQMMALAAEAGLTLEEVLGGSRKMGGSSKGNVAPKYRNPDNADETWTGRGRMPHWLTAKLQKRGVSKEDFAI